MKQNLMFAVLLLASFAIVQHVTAQTEHAAAHTASQTTITADKVWTNLMEGNRRFVAGKPKAAHLVELRESLAQGQHPKAIVLSLMG